MLSVLITVFHFFFSKKISLELHFFGLTKNTVTFFNLLFAKRWILTPSKSCHLMVFNTVQPLSVSALPLTPFTLSHLTCSCSSIPYPLFLVIFFINSNFAVWIPSPQSLCSMDVSWLSSWLCYFDLLLTMLSAFGESPRTSLPSMWGECSSYLKEYFRSEDFFYRIYFNIDSTTELGASWPWCWQSRAVLLVRWASWAQGFCPRTPSTQRMPGATRPWLHKL